MEQRGSRGGRRGRRRSPGRWVAPCPGSTAGWNENRRWLQAGDFHQHGHLGSAGLVAICMNREPGLRFGGKQGLPSGTGQWEKLRLSPAHGRVPVASLGLMQQCKDLPFRGQLGEPESCAEMCGERLGTVG